MDGAGNPRIACADVISEDCANNSRIIQICAHVHACKYSNSVISVPSLWLSMVLTCVYVATLANNGYTPLA